MVILRTRNKITDFLMILAWASRFNSDLSQDVSEMRFTVRDLQCLSHDNAMFKSFKLTVPKSEFADLFDGNIWPQGIRVRKFIPPRSGSNEQSI